MLAWIEANGVLAAGVALLLLGLVWLLAMRRRRAPARRDYRDVLSEGAGPAARNAALIAAPPAASVAPPRDDAPSLAVEGGDDLTRIKGLGPKLARILADLGVTRFEQIAAWTEADLAAIDGKLGAFAGRPARDAWVAQAALLASGDVAAYEAKFGKV